MRSRMSLILAVNYAVQGARCIPTCVSDNQVIILSIMCLSIKYHLLELFLKIL
jgi:hypothetical protein